MADPRNGGPKSFRGAMYKFAYVSTYVGLFTYLLK